MNEPAPQEPNVAHVDDDSLVAYLDGELSEAETAQIETRLANEQSLRERLQALQQTWDLLDSLPAVRTSDAFTQSTIAFAVHQATRETRAQQSWIARWLPSLLVVAAAGATGAGSYQVVRYAQNAPVRELIRDLRLIENVELYRTIDRNVDYVEFLKKLDQAQLFSPRGSENE